MQAYKDAAQWIKNRHRQLVQQLSAWSQLNSGSTNLQGLQQQAQLLQQQFLQLTPHVILQAVPTMTVVDDSGQVMQQQVGKVLLACHNKQAKKQILLTGHMDTVFAADSPFQTVTSVRPGYLRGPGVSDMKGGLLVMLTALQALMRSSYANAIGWQVLINADEEIGSLSSASLLQQVAKQADIGFVYEPALDEQGCLAANRKGSGKFTVVALGRAAHAGRAFAAGRNAITALAAWIVAVAELNGQRPGVTINMGIIRGGQAVNVVADHAVLRVDVRTTEVSDENWFLQQTAAISARIEKQHDVQLQQHGAFSRKPKKIEDETPDRPRAPRHSSEASSRAVGAGIAGETLTLLQWVKAVAAEIGVDISWRDSGGCCDGNNLAAAGLANVDTLGVCGGMIHSDQEYLLTDSLVERACLSARLLLEFAAADKPL